MLINFFKYQGAGNDFILLDNRNKKYNSLNNSQIKLLCNRHFGIGADGLMLLNLSDELDFSMKYYNSDGNESTMCGNGGRCIVKFANELGIINTQTTFSAIDGIHKADILENSHISLKMNDVKDALQENNYFILNTGSPHYVEFVDSIEKIDFISEARKIRYNDKYKNEGININFVEIRNGKLFSRTYERGVEFETLACGTGAVAIAIANSIKNNCLGKNNQIINAKGGLLSVSFINSDNQVFTDVYLNGPAEKAFAGEIVL